MQMNLMQFSYKALRATAWLLLFAALIMLVTGFFMTKELSPVDYQTARQVHTVVMPLVFIALFYVHSLSGIFVMSLRYKLINNKYFRITAAAFWTLAFVSLVALFFLD
jgi:thiosulfate reductase cytochrome b subunit